MAVYLNELAPPAFRGLYPGTVYQLGNAVSSAAAQIEVFILINPSVDTNAFLYRRLQQAFQFVSQSMV